MNSDEIKNETLPEAAQANDNAPESAAIEPNDIESGVPESDVEPEQSSEADTLDTANDNKANDSWSLSKRSKRRNRRRDFEPSRRGRPTDTMATGS
jgi:hypothetical protein